MSSSSCSTSSQWDDTPGPRNDQDSDIPPETHEFQGYAPDGYVSDLDHGEKPDFDVPKSPGDLNPKDVSEPSFACVIFGKGNVIPERETLYRGDTQFPRRVFNQGFQARGDDFNIFNHARDSSSTYHSSGYISTSTSEHTAANFGLKKQSRGYLYEIEKPFGTVDVAQKVREGLTYEESVAKRAKDPAFRQAFDNSAGESEFAVKRQIKTRNVKGAWSINVLHTPAGEPYFVRNSKFIPNPNYVPSGLTVNKAWTFIKGVGIAVTGIAVYTDAMELKTSYRECEGSKNYTPFFDKSTSILTGWAGAAALGLAVGAKITAATLPIAGPYAPVCGMIGGAVASSIGYFAGRELSDWYNSLRDLMPRFGDVNMSAMATGYDTEHTHRKLGISSPTGSNDEKEFVNNILPAFGQAFTVHGQTGMFIDNRPVRQILFNLAGVLHGSKKANDPCSAEAALNFHCAAIDPGNRTAYFNKMYQIVTSNWTEEGGYPVFRDLFVTELEKIIQTPKFKGIRTLDEDILRRTSSGIDTRTFATHLSQYPMTHAASIYFNREIEKVFYTNSTSAGEVNRIQLQRELVKESVELRQPYSRRSLAKSNVEPELLRAYGMPENHQMTDENQRILSGTLRAMQSRELQRDHDRKVMSDINGVRDMFGLIGEFGRLSGDEYMCKLSTVGVSLATITASYASMTGAFGVTMVTGAAALTPLTAGVAATMALLQLMFSSDGDGETLSRQLGELYQMMSSGFNTVIANQRIIINNCICTLQAVKRTNNHLNVLETMLTKSFGEMHSQRLITVMGYLSKDLNKEMQLNEDKRGELVTELSVWVDDLLKNSIQTRTTITYDAKRFLAHAPTDSLPVLVQQLSQLFPREIGQIPQLVDIQIYTHVANFFAHVGLNYPYLRHNYSPIVDRATKLMTDIKKFVTCLEHYKIVNRLFDQIDEYRFHIGWAMYRLRMDGGIVAGKNLRSCLDVENPTTLKIKELVDEMEYRRCLLLMYTELINNSYRDRISKLLTKEGFLNSTSQQLAVVQEDLYNAIRRGDIDEFRRTLLYGVTFYRYHIHDGDCSPRPSTVLGLDNYTEFEGVKRLGNYNYYAMQHWLYKSHKMYPGDKWVECCLYGNGQNNPYILGNINTVYGPLYSGNFGALLLQFAIPGLVYSGHGQAYYYGGVLYRSMVPGRVEVCDEIIRVCNEPSHNLHHTKVKIAYEYYTAVDAGQDPSRDGVNVYTLLWIVCILGKVRILEQFTVRLLPIDLTRSLGTSGFTPLMMAVFCNQMDVVRYIMNKITDRKEVFTRCYHSKATDGITRDISSLIRTQEMADLLGFFSKGVGIVIRGWTCVPIRNVSLTSTRLPTVIALEGCISNLAVLKQVSESRKSTPDNKLATAFKDYAHGKKLLKSGEVEASQEYFLLAKGAFIALNEEGEKRIYLKMIEKINDYLF